MLQARHFVLDGAWHGEEPLLAVCGNDAAVRVWDHAAKKERVFVGHTSPVLGVAWRPNTRQLASAGQDGSVRIWSMDAPELIQEYPAEVARWNSDGSKAIVHADLLPPEIDRHYHPDIELIGDLAATLKALNTRFANCCPTTYSSKRCIISRGGSKRSNSNSLSKCSLNSSSANKLWQSSTQ